MPGPKTGMFGNFVATWCQPLIWGPILEGNEQQTQQHVYEGEVEEDGWDGWFCGNVKLINHRRQ